jgi:starch synthase
VILNGIDYQKWDPSTDACITEKYSVENLEARKSNKRYLLNKLGLPTSDREMPLITIISRLDFQKGIDLLIDGFEMLQGSDFQLVILGSGSQTLEDQCRQLEERYPHQVKAQLKFDPQLANQLYGGADMILIPSRFEPCGLTQMIAMRYGCLPVARATGGFKDSIQDGVNGFLFNDLTSSAVGEAIRRAIGIFQKKSLWKKMQVSAMNTDFSWNKSARAYARLYRKLLG